MNKQVSVLISDSQFLTRQGIVTLLDGIDGFEVKAELSDNSKLDQLMLEQQPDLVVVGLSEGNEKIIDELREVATKSEFLVISSVLKRNVLRELLDIGIKGIVTKNCSEEEITNGVRAVSDGNRFFCNTILDLVVSNPNDDKENCEPTNLSPREFEVLSLITKGYKTNQIAEELFVSVHTVNSHRKNILRKLNLKSPAELIVYALESGLVKSWSLVLVMSVT